MNFRRAAKEDYMEGTEVGSLKGVYKTMKETDVWLNLG